MESQNQNGAEEKGLVVEVAAGGRPKQNHKERKPHQKRQQKQRQISIRIAPKVWNQRPQRIQEIPLKLKMQSLRRLMVMIHNRLKHPPTKGLVAIQEAKKQGRLLLKGAYP